MSASFIRLIFPAFAVSLLISGTAQSQTFSDPSPSTTFDQAIQNLPVLENFTFGTASGRTVPNLSALANSFQPYGIAGTTVINQEWERYQTFNSTNFVFTPTTLNLTATIPTGGGLFPGGIHSGQIWTKQTYQPGIGGKVVYAFEVRMRIPSGTGMWPAAWLYTKSGEPGMNDGSEIDDPEFFNMEWQNEFDWTSTLHGPGVGPMLYNIRTNPWVWHPGLNFSGDFHDFQTLWTEDMVYSYVDGTLVSQQAFHWTAKGQPQFGINLAVGSYNSPGLQPSSLSQFPATLQVDHLTIWAQ